MDKKYEDSIHRTGRIGIIIGILLMLGIPAIVSTVYDVWPERGPGHHRRQQPAGRVHPHLHR